jgi:hypothetical protein
MPLLYNSVQLYNLWNWTYNGVEIIIGATRTSLTGIIRDLTILQPNLSDVSSITGTVSDLAAGSCALDDFNAITATFSDYAAITGTVSDFSAILVTL